MECLSEVKGVKRTLSAEEKLILKEWMKKRKLTTILAMFHVAIFGIEYTSVTISALYYLKLVLKIDNPKMFYGFVQGAMFLSATISGVLLGKLFDKSRNARGIILLTVVLAIIGNLLYVLPYSPWLLVLGRFLCGWTDATQPVMTGEFSRVYKKHELGGVLANYTTVLSICFAVGPCTPLVLNYVHFNIGYLEIDQYNSVGLLLATFATIFFIMAYFGLSNLTIEPGYTIFMSTLSEDELVSCQKRNDEKLLTLVDLVKSFDIMLIIVGTSYGMFLNLTIDLMYNLVAIYNFHWSIITLSLITLVAVCLYAIFMFRDERIFLIFVILMFLAWIDICLLNFTTSISISTFYAQVIALIIIIYIRIFYGFSIQACGRYLLFKLVPSHSSSYSDGVRNALTRIFCCIAFTSAAIMYPYFGYLSPLFIILVIIFLLMLYVRRNVFI